LNIAVVLVLWFCYGSDGKSDKGKILEKSKRWWEDSIKICFQKREESYGLN
jgi:hypothetical protein